jgi:hypothetical protein
MNLNSNLIAACGINCGICSAYLRDKNKCLGCRAIDANKPVTRVRCKIKTCEFFRNSNAKFCFKCDNFSCGNLKHLDKRYRTRYNTSVIQNLENIRKLGIRKFIENEKSRWACPDCRGVINVHKGVCSNCGAQLYQIPKEFA